MLLSDAARAATPAPGKEIFEVELPTGEGYVATAAEGSTSPVEKGADYSFTIEISDGYKAGEDFVVKANDVYQMYR